MIKFQSENELRQFIVEEVLFTSEVAELLGITRQSVSGLVKRGRLEPIKDGNKERIFLKSDIDYYLEQKTKGEGRS